ncbi:MAG: WG repeat-containing protein [Candidatus Obscuribacterales bacterium]
MQSRHGFLCLGLALLFAVLNPCPTSAYKVVGLIDQNGKTIVPGKYRWIRYLGSGLFLAEEICPDNPKRASLRAHLLDCDGKIIEPTLPDGCCLADVYLTKEAASLNAYVHAAPPGTILAIHSKSGFGLCNFMGQILLKPEFKALGSKKGDLVPVCDTRHSRPYLQFLFNTATKKRLSVPAFAILHNSNTPDLFKIEIRANPGGPNRDARWAYLSTDGNIQIKPLFSSIEDFTPDGLAIAYLHGTRDCVFLDRTGRIRSPHFRQATPFLNNLSIVQTDTGYGVLNRKFRFRIRPIYSRIDRIFDDVFVVKLRDDSPFKAIDEAGKPLFDLPSSTAFVHKYNDELFRCSLFDNQRAITQIAFIDRSGKIRKTFDQEFIGAPFPSQELEYGFTSISKLMPGRGYFRGLLNQEGKLIQPMQEAFYTPVTRDRVVKLYSVESFSSGSWRNPDPDGIGWGMNRLFEFSDFLRCYDLIGMKREQVQALLGAPDHQEIYYLAYPGCGSGMLAFEIEYKNEKVLGWRELRNRGGIRTYTGNWVTSNQVFDPTSTRPVKVEQATLELFPKY